MRHYAGFGTFLSSSCMLYSILTCLNFANPFRQEGWKGVRFMNTYLMKKAMIETAVDRGIKEMEDDPKRSIRRLTDLGKQFSRNRFQETVFSVMQELLNNENSAYYDMMHNLIKNSEKESLKKFGVNFGYMSWSYGAARVREKETKEGVLIPWTIMLRYDAKAEDGLTMDRLSSLMEQGQDLGIYAYFIRECADDEDSYALLELLERYKECAYVWFKSNGRLTAAQIQMLRVCRNALVCLPLSDPETSLTAALLRDQKIPFALYLEYGRNSILPGLTDVYKESVLASETAMLFLISADGADCAAADLAYRSRLEQKYPFVIMDYYGDGQSISRVLCEHTNLLEIGSDGRMIRPDGQKGEPFPFELPLIDALRQVMPPKKPFSESHPEA